MLLKCFNIVQRPTFWLSVRVLIFLFPRCPDMRKVPNPRDSPGVGKLGGGFGFRSQRSHARWRDRCLRFPETTRAGERMTSLETSLGLPVLLPGLDTASPSSLRTGGTGSLDIPEGPQRTQNRTQRPIFHCQEGKSARMQLGTWENLKIQISSWFCSSFSP